MDMYVDESIELETLTAPHCLKIILCRSAFLRM